MKGKMNKRKDENDRLRAGRLPPDPWGGTKTYTQKQPPSNGLNGDSWAEPKPLSTSPLAPVPVFDADTLLPPVLRDWIVDEAERMPCPTDFIAAPAMVALGSITGARCAIAPKSYDPWLIVPNLWCGVVGDPSSKKSPAVGAALAPIVPLIGQAEATFQLAYKEFEGKLAA